MKRKLLILGVALMMIASATACSSQSGTTKKDDADVKTESTVASTDKKSDQSEKSEKFPEFKAKTVDGEDISSDIFKNSKLTVVNTWGSWCGPCVQEIPELQKLSENMKDKNVKVIGMAQDAGSDFQAVKEILDKNKVTYQNIIPSGTTEEFVMSLQAFPTTFFVDSEGKILYAIQGSKNLEGFTQIIEDLLAKM